MIENPLTPALIIFALAAISGFGLYGRAGRGHADGLLLACVPILSCLTLCACALEFFHGPYSDWDAGRLAAVVGAAKGHSVYASLSEGAVQTTMYPPGWILAYLPAALGKTPTAVLMIGYLLAQLYSLIPVALACVIVTQNRRTAWIGFSIFIFFLIQSFSLEWACFLPHADAPALGLALLALLALHLALRQAAVSNGRVLLIALLGCASVATKQTMIPVLPAILIWSFWVRDRSVATRLLAAMVLVGGAALALSAHLFGASALYLNLVSIPGSCPWKGHFPFNVFSGLQEMTKLAVVPIMLAFVGGTVFAVAAPDTQTFKPRLWPLLFLCAVLMLPTSVLGRVKMGGVESAMAPSLYFFYLAALAAALEVISLLESFGSPARSRTAVHNMLAGVTLVIILGWTLLSLQQLRYSYPHPKENLSQLAYDFLLDKGTGACFPAYPLAHLLAEDRLYHFSQAVADRESLAGIPLGDAQRAAHLPDNPELVCWSERLFETERMRVPKEFTDYDRRTPVPELPDFICFRRSSSETATPTNGR
jgi:hypothetical protein